MMYKNYYRPHPKDGGDNIFSLFTSKGYPLSLPLQDRGTLLFSPPTRTEIPSPNQDRRIGVSSLRPPPPSSQGRGTFLLPLNSPARTGVPSLTSSPSTTGQGHHGCAARMVCLLRSRRRTVLFG